MKVNLIYWKIGVGERESERGREREWFLWLEANAWCTFALELVVHCGTTARWLPDIVLWFFPSVVSSGQICSSRKVYFHTDAAQAVGKIPVDVNDMKIDLMSISGHKIYGPKGTSPSSSFSALHFPVNPFTGVPWTHWGLPLLSEVVSSECLAECKCHLFTYFYIYFSNYKRKLT